MTKGAKHRFLFKLEQMAEKLYKHGDSISHDEAWERHRSFIWGFAEAGKTIQLVTSEDIQRVIDRAHQRVYGESRASRIERLSPAGDGSEEPDWDAFDVPTPLCSEVEKDQICSTRFTLPVYVFLSDFVGKEVKTALHQSKEHQRTLPFNQPDILNIHP